QSSADRASHAAEVSPVWPSGQHRQSFRSKTWLPDRMDAESSGLHDPPARHDRTHHAHFYVVPSLGGRGFARRCRLEHRGLPRLDLFVAGNSRLEPGPAYGLRLAVAIGRDALL